jgi:Platelet-activating factor acetylhydrolase, isoform II
MRRRAPDYFSLLAILLVLNLGVSTRAEQNPVSSIPKLPEPRGPFGVGRVAFDWIDLNRPGDMAEDRGAHSELMVYLWYPTDATSKEAKSTLFPGAKQIDSSPDVSASLKNKMFGGNWPLVVSGAITSHAQENSPIAKTPKAFPVILLSPGANGTCFQYSSAIEDLVSHGYVVAAIEHTSEVFGVVFLDGKIHTYSAARIPKESLPSPGATKEEYEAKLEAWYRHCVDVRAADDSFVLDRLIELNKAVAKSSQFSQRLDLANVAAVGHSRGGWSSIVACRRDERIKACVNEDGNAGGQGLQFPGAPIPKQPILYVELPPILKPGTTPDDWIVLKQLHLTAEEWMQQWHQTVLKEFSTFPAGGYFVQLTQPGLEHYSFSDEVILRAAKDGNKEKEEMALHGLRLTEEVTTAFLDEILKNEKQTTLRDSPDMLVVHFERKN